MNKSLFRGVLAAYPTPWTLSSNGDVFAVLDANNDSVFPFDDDESSFYEMIVVAVNELAARLDGE